MRFYIQVFVFTILTLLVIGDTLKLREQHQYIQGLSELLNSQASELGAMRTSCRGGK